VGTLAHRRAKSRVTMLYKIRNNLVDIAPEQCLTGGDYRTRGEHKYKIISAKNIYKFSCFPRTIITWNYLPVTVALLAWRLYRCITKINKVNEVLEKKNFLITYIHIYMYIAEV
jgi:hypothetical protein